MNYCNIWIKKIELFVIFELKYKQNTQQYHIGDLIVSRSSPSHGIYFIERGTVHSVALVNNNKEAILTLEPNEIFGEVFFFKISLFHLLFQLFIFPFLFLFCNIDRDF